MVKINFSSAAAAAAGVGEEEEEGLHGAGLAELCQWAPWLAAEY